METTKDASVIADAVAPSFLFCLSSYQIDCMVKTKWQARYTTPITKLIITTLDKVPPRSQHQKPAENPRQVSTISLPAMS